MDFTWPIHAFFSITLTHWRLVAHEFAMNWLTIGSIWLDFDTKPSPDLMLTYFEWPYLGKLNSNGIFLSKNAFECRSQNISHFVLTQKIDNSSCSNIAISHSPIVRWPHAGISMMTSSNGNIFRVTGPLWGKQPVIGGFPSQRARDAELWCFLWCAPEQTIG